MTKKQALTREEHKKLKLTEQKQPAVERVETTKPARGRPIPSWLRFVILVALIIICATAGALVGYSGIGSGKVADVFKPSTWSHIYDLVEKK
jgi:hypothetical protein